MGGKRSSGTSSTQPTIPPWLQGIIQPLLSGTAAKMQTLQNQGWNVLQGNPELNSSVTLEDLANTNFMQQAAQAQATPQQLAEAAATSGYSRQR